MTTRIRTLTLAIVLVASLAAAPAAFAGEHKTETIRAFSKPVSFVYTSVDGTVTQSPPDAPPQVGDVFEISSLDFVGNRKKHAKKATMSDYLRCTFTAELEPDCFGYTAVGGSLLRFHGFEVHRRHRSLPGRHRQGAPQQGGRGRVGLRGPRQAGPLRRVKDSFRAGPYGRRHDEDHAFHHHPPA